MGLKGLAAVAFAGACAAGVGGAAAQAPSCQTNIDLPGRWVVLYQGTQPCVVDLAANGAITRATCERIASTDARGNPSTSKLELRGSLFMAANCEISGKLWVSFRRGGRDVEDAYVVRGWMQLGKDAFKLLGDGRQTAYYDTVVFDGILRRPACDC